MKSSSEVMMRTAPEIAWVGAGRPSLEKFPPSDHVGTCATCGAKIDGQGVAVDEIDNKAFSNHAESFKFGGSHVCMGCGWLYGAGRSKPGNFIATERWFELAVISLDSVVDDKRPWLEILKELASLPPETEVCGVLTTDVKIRLWPRMQPATIGNFGLYVHSPDHDISQHVRFDLKRAIVAADFISSVLSLGFSKTNAWLGLLRDHARASKNIAHVFELEQRLADMRREPEFLPAVIIAGVSKKAK